MLTNKEKNFVSVVAYVHDCELELKNFLPLIMKQLSDNFDKYELIFVNDASADASETVIKAYMEQFTGNMVSIINMGHYQGIEASMNAGVDLAIGDFVFEFDYLNVNYEADLLMEIYRVLLSGYDIVYASPGQPSSFRSRLFYKLFNWGRRSDELLQHDTFRLLSRRAINRIQGLNNAIPYRKAVYLNSGLRMKTVYYHALQNSGKRLTDMEAGNKFDIAISSLILFTNVIQRIFISISIIFFLFAVGVGIYTVITYFGQTKPVEGWAPLMGFMSAGFCGVFLLMTFIIKYLSVMLGLIFKRQKYLVESIEKL